MKKTLFMLSVVLGSLCAASPHLLSIDDLSLMALRFSPDLNVSRADVTISEQRLRGAEGDYLPRVDFSGAAGLTGVKTDGGTPSGTDASIMTGTLTASQLLYDFGKTTGNIDAYSYEANASAQTLRQNISDKLFDVKQIYYDLLKTQSLILVNEQNVKLNEQQLTRAQRYFEAGIRTKIDVSDANVNLIRAKLDLRVATFNYKQARVTLERIIGLNPYNGNYHLASLDLDSPDFIPKLPDVTASVDALIQQAYTRRGILQAYAAQVESSRESIRSVKGNYYPTFGLQGDYTYTKSDRALQTFLPEQRYSAFAVMNWNLYEGMKTDAAEQQARATWLKNSSAYSDMRLQIKQDVTEAQLNLLKSKDTVILSQSLADAAKEKFVQAQKRYEHGLSDYIELQQARQDYIDAFAQLVINYYDFYIDLASRQHQIGE